MNKRFILSLSVTTVLGLVLYSSSAVAQSARDIVGTWSIASAEAFGPTPKGILGLPRFRGQVRCWDQGIWFDGFVSSSLG